MPGGRRGPHKYYSRAQWKWAFATHQPWARRHAHQTPGGKKIRYRRLPGHTSHARSLMRRRGRRRRR